MAYEVFTKKTPRIGSPMLSFSKLGQIQFNQTASKILEKHAIELVLLLWDASDGKLAIKSISNKKDPRAYRIRYNPKGNGATFSAKTFLDFAGIDYSERKPIPVDINPDLDMLVEVKIPDSILKKKTPQMRLVIEKEKLAK